MMLERWSSGAPATALQLVEVRKTQVALLAEAARAACDACGAGEGRAVGAPAVRPTPWKPFLYCQTLVAGRRAPNRSPDQRRGGGRQRHTAVRSNTTWLSAKLDSMEAMPSSRVSLVFRKV